MIKYLIVLLASFIFCFKSFADSPLTSTYFFRAYSEEPLVKEGQLIKNLVNNNVLSALADNQIKLEVKLAIINALGWKIDGMQNSSLYLDYLIKIGKYKNEMDLINSKNSSDLICYAYLKSMDNYFNVTIALQIAEKAAEIESDSKAIYVINILIRAQDVLNNSRFSMKRTFCKVYKIGGKLSNLSSFKNDFKDEALRFILPYINSYKKYCL